MSASRWPREEGNKRRYTLGPLRGAVVIDLSGYFWDNYTGMMFGTLHWSHHGNEADFVERPHGSSNLERKPACDRCRARKVKCRHFDNQACTRCKRLGMACTFSTVKHRGDHRQQKISINKHTPQQHSQDWPDVLAHSSASLSCKDTEHREEPEDKDRGKQLPVSSLPNPGDGDGNDDRDVNDIASSYDLSFLSNFGHEPGDRSGEDFSSLALFSAISPSTQSEPERIYNTTEILGTFLSPPLTSEEEESRHCLPNVGYTSDTTNPQDPSFFDMCIASQTSTAFPPSGPSGQQPCDCLAAVVFAVERFEASCLAGHRSELDSIIAHQKEAIQRCRAQLECSSCYAKREALVLLVFMLEKIVAACARMIGLYRANNAQFHYLPSSSSSLSVNGGPSLDIGPVPAQADCPPNWRELLLGDYEISSSLEWENLVRVLILLQLRAVMELLADVQSMKGEALGETLTASLAQAGIRLGELERDIYFL